jgi:hypothetical protein
MYYLKDGSSSITLETQTSCGIPEYHEQQILHQQTI